MIWPTREIREKGMKAVMDDPYRQSCATDVLFDGKRMFFWWFSNDCGRMKILIRRIGLPQKKCHLNFGGIF